MNMGMNLPFAQPQMGMPQAMGQQIAGSALGGLSSIAGGASTLAGYGTMAAGGLSLMGIGGAGMAAAAGIPGMAVAGGLAAGAFGAENLYTGFQQQQQVGRVLQQRFGGQIGVGGRAGGGFTSGETGGIAEMVRTMGDQNMFTNMEELTRVMDKTAQMGLFRGVQSAREFKERFQKTVDTLKEVAQAMHTSLEGATQFMDQQRNMGFFSGADISRSLMRTRFNAGASGMSMQQMQQIGMQGTQMGRMMGMRGRTGAGAMMEAATNIGVGMQMGVFDDEMVAEATGGLTGAEGAQALAAQMMDTNQRWLSRGAGRVMLASLWDPETGGINQERLQQAMRGGNSFQGLRRQGRANIAATGGRRSDFFLNEKRLRGELMEQGGGYLMTGMLAQHIAGRRGLDLEDPIVQRWVQRQTRQSQSQVEFQIRQFREMPRILEERRMRTDQQVEQEARTRAREGTGFSGFRRRWQHWFEKEVENPIRQAGADFSTSISQAIDGMVDDMEGRVKTTVSERTKGQLREFAETGKLGGVMSFSRFQEMRAGLGSTIDEGGTMGAIGRWMGTRQSSISDRLGAWHKDLGYNLKDNSQKLELLNNINRTMRMTGADFGYSSEQMAGFGSRGRELLMQNIGTGTGLQRYRAERARFGDMTAKEKQGFFRERTDIFRQDPEMAAALNAARKRGGRAGEYAMAADMERRMGIGGTDMASPFGEMGGGRSYEQLAADLEAAERSHQEYANLFGTELAGDYGKEWLWEDAGGEGKKRKISRETYEARRERERGSRGHVWIFGSKNADVWSKEKVGRRYGKSVVDLMSNEKMAGLMTRAAGGEKAAIRELQQMSLMSADDAAAQGIKDVEALGMITQKLADGHEGTRQGIRKLTEKSVLRDMLAVYERERELGEKLQTSVRNNEDVRDAATSIGPSSLSRLEEVARYQSEGNWEKAEEARRKFYMENLGKKGTDKLIGALMGDTGTQTLGAGLGRAARLIDMWKKGGERSILGYALGEAGLGLSAISQKNIKDVLSRATSAEGLSTKDLWGELTSKAKRSVGSYRDFAKETGRYLEKMREGTDETERLTLAAGEGSELAAQRRSTGPDYRETMSDLATKQEKHLSSLVGLQKLALSRMKNPPTADEIAAAVGGRTGKTQDPSNGASQKGKSP